MPPELSAPKTTSGFVGCTCRAAKLRPVNVVPAGRNQLRPPSMDFNKPAQQYESPEKLGSPVPAYTMFGMFGASTMAPTAIDDCASVLAAQRRPAFRVSHTPP